MRRVELSELKGTPGKHIQQAQICAQESPVMGNGVNWMSDSVLDCQRRPRRLKPRRTVNVPPGDLHILFQGPEQGAYAATVCSRDTPPHATEPYTYIWILLFCSNSLFAYVYELHGLRPKTSYTVVPLVAHNGCCMHAPLPHTV